MFGNLRYYSTGTQFSTYRRLSVGIDKSNRDSLTLSSQSFPLYLQYKSESCRFQPPSLIRSENWAPAISNASATPAESKLITSVCRRTQIIQRFLIYKCDSDRGRVPIIANKRDQWNLCVVHMTFDIWDFGIAWIQVQFQIQLMPPQLGNNYNFHSLAKSTLVVWLVVSGNFSSSVLTFLRRIGWPSLSDDFVDIEWLTSFLPPHCLLVCHVRIKPWWACWGEEHVRSKLVVVCRSLFPVTCVVVQKIAWIDLQGLWKQIFCINCLRWYVEKHCLPD